jgi:predicted metalloprotease
MLRRTHDNRPAGNENDGMKWFGRRESSNIEDRRGGGMGGMNFPSGGIRIGRGAGFGGAGFIAVVLLAMLFGVDPRLLLEGIEQQPGIEQPAPSPGQQQAGDDPLRRFVAVVLADTEDVWNAQLERQAQRRYQEPTLVLFSNAVRSACGVAGSAVGPFYCPGDRKVYLDLAFFRALKDRFKAPGDFAQAYVIAHEVGHHVQTLLGISQQVMQARARLSQSQANALSVRQELQADCFAGVWAHHAQRTKNILDEGDIDEALNAASAIGDDTLQRQAQGHVVPDAFTHGSAAQRQRWFRNGLKDGRMQDCDTFNARTL